MNANNVMAVQSSDAARPPARLKRDRSMTDRRLAAFGALAEFATRSPDRPKGLGEFSVAATAGDTDFFAYPQIRAAPIRRSHGLEFRYSVGLHAMRVTRPFKFAPHLLASANAFVCLTNLKPKAVRLREIATRGLGAAGERSVPMRLVALGVEPVLPHDNLLLYVIDFETLGDNLNPSFDRVAETNLATLESKLSEKVARHIFRDDLRSQVMSVGGIAYIDELALRVIDASDVTRAEAIQLLATTRRLEFDASDEKSQTRHAELFWSDGVLRATVGSGSDDWQCRSSSMSFKPPAIPDTIMDALPGRPLGVLVQHPLLPTAAIIRALHPYDGQLLVDIDMGILVIDAVSGEPRDEDWSYDSTTPMAPAIRTVSNG